MKVDQQQEHETTKQGFPLLDFTTSWSRPTEGTKRKSRSFFFSLFSPLIFDTIWWSFSIWTAFSLWFSFWCRTWKGIVFSFSSLLFDCNVLLEVTLPNKLSSHSAYLSQDCDHECRRTCVLQKEINFHAKIAPECLTKLSTKNSSFSALNSNFISASYPET